MASEVASVYARIGADLTGFKRGMATFDRGVRTAGGTFRNFTQGITQGIGMAFGNAAIRTFRNFGDAISDAVGSAVSMEQGIADIRSIMGLTSEETERLEKLISSLAIDPKLRVSAKEASATIEMLGRNGIAIQDIFDGAARSTILMANATGADFATAADVATDVMAQFKIEAANMIGAVDQITGVTRNSKFDINDYRLAIGMAGGVAASVGVEFEDFNAIMAATASTFTGGSDWGTSFKTFIQRLVPQSAEAADKMRELGLYSGLTGDEFEAAAQKIKDIQEKISNLDPTSKNYQRRLQDLKQELAEVRASMQQGESAFFDSAGQMKSTAEIAAALNKAFAGLSEEQKISAASTIFGTDAMRMAFAIAQNGGDVIEEFKRKIGSTSAEEAAAIRTDTLAAKWATLKDIIGEYMRQSAKPFLVHLRALVEWATVMANTYGPRVVEAFSRLADMMPALGKRALALFNTITGPGVVKTVQILAAAFRGLGSTLAKLVRPFKEAFGGLFSELQAMRSTGFADIFAVVMRRLGQAVKGFADVVRKEIAPAVWKGLVALWNGVMQWADGLSWSDVIDWARAMWDWAVEVWGKVQPHLVEFWNYLSSWVTDPQKRQTLWNAIVNGWNVFAEWAAAIWNWMRPGLVAAWNYLSSWVTDPQKRQLLWNAVVTGWNVFAEWANAIWEWMRPGLTAAWSYLSSWVTDPQKRQMLWGAVVSGWNVFSEWAEAIWNWMKPGLTAAWNYLSSWVTDPQKRRIIREKANEWGSVLTNWANYLWEGGDGNGGLKKPLTRWWEQFNSWMVENFPKTTIQLGILRDKFGDFFDQLDRLIREKVPGVKRTWDQMWRDMFGLDNWDAGIAEITKNLGEVVDIFRGMGMILEGFKTNTWGPIWRGITEIVTSAWAIIKSNLDVNPFFQGLLTGLNGWAERIRGAWRFLMDGLVEGTKSGMFMIAGAFSGLHGIIMGAIHDVAGRIRNDIWNPMLDIGRRIIDGITDGIRGAINKLQEVFTWMAQQAPEWVRNALGIRSPSKVFAEIGRQVTAGFAQGIGDNLTAPRLSIDRMVRHTVEAVPGAASMAASSTQRIELMVRGESNLPVDRAKLQELARLLQRELTLSGARVSYAP